MALNPEQKAKILKLVANGNSAKDVAKEVGCSRRTVSRVVTKAGKSTVMTLARRAMAAKKLDVEGASIAKTVRTFAEREPELQETLWNMFESLSGLLEETLEITGPESIPPKQLPALARACCDVASAYADFSDRINGLTILADEVQKINNDRAA